MAAKAVKERWRVLRLEARARESNDDVAPPDEKPQAQREPRIGSDEEQYLDEATLAAATAWGDLVGIEVRVRPMARGRVRLEVQFNSPQAAIEAAARLAEAVSGSEGPSR